MQEVFENIIKALEEKRDEAEKNMELSDVLSEVNSYGGMFDAFDKSIEIVKQTAAEYNNGWIPCSRGVMPRANGWYLVTNHLGDVQEQRWSANHWEKLRDDAVLAWRELPSPYQQKGYNDENTN